MQAANERAVSLAETTLPNLDAAIAALSRIRDEGRATLQSIEAASPVVGKALATTNEAR